MFHADVNYEWRDDSVYAIFYGDDRMRAYYSLARSVSGIGW